MLLSSLLALPLSSSAANYVLESSTNNVTWQAITPTNSATQSFFRLHVLNPGSNIVVLASLYTLPASLSTASFSNGTIIVTAPAAASNDWNAIQTAMSSSTNNVPVILNIGKPQP